MLHLSLQTVGSVDQPKNRLWIADSSYWSRSQFEYADVALMPHSVHNAFVLCSQVLGEMGLSGKASERWLAYAVRELVAKSYPSLCISYIDLENVGEANVAPLMSPHEQQPHSWELSPLREEPRNRSRGSKPYQLLRQYSVLLQYSDGTGQGSGRPGVRELYR